MAVSHQDSGCRVCGAPVGEARFSASIFDQRVSYFECSACGFVQTQNPTWLDKAYASPINVNDTGIMQRNQVSMRLVMATLAALDKRFDRVVDFAGGYGILVRLLRDIGVDAYWDDPYCQNLVAVGFENNGGKAQLATAFEVLEHLVHPAEELERIFALSPNALFSTLVIPTPTPKPEDWWYYGLNHGQHVAFYRVKTLATLAKKFGKHLLTDGFAYHLMTDAPVPAWRWSLYKKLAQRCLPLLTRSMKSKIWADHDKMSRA